MEFLPLDTLTGKVRGTSSFVGSTVGKPIDFSEVFVIGISSGGLSGVTPLVSGQSYIDVVFSTAQPSANWMLTECSVVNMVDATPLNLWPGIITSKSTTGFRLQLNGKPDTANYDLHWAIAIVGGGGGGVTDFLELTDTPNSYAGQAGKVVVVNPGATALQFSASAGGGGSTVTSIAYSATINVDASSAPSGGLLIVQVGTLTGNVTLANPTSPTNRQRLEYVLKQDGTGNRSLTLGAKFRIPSSSSMVFPANSSNNPDYAAVNRKTRLMAEYDLADDKWDVIAFVPGY